MVHIPYAGGNPAQLALLSGQVDLNFDNLGVRVGQHQGRQAEGAGGDDGAALERHARRADDRRERARSSASARFDIDTWFGMFGPAHLPAETTARLNKAFVDALASSELRARWPRSTPSRCRCRPSEFARLRQGRARQVRAARQGLRCADRIAASARQAALLDSIALVHPPCDPFPPTHSSTHDLRPNRSAARSRRAARRGAQPRHRRPSDRPDAPLYGEGLGLDSIDILEVALVVSQRYGFQLRSDDEDNVRIFRSLASLADAHRRAPPGLGPRGRSRCVPVPSPSRWPASPTSLGSHWLMTARRARRGTRSSSSCRCWCSPRSSPGGAASGLRRGRGPGRRRPGAPGAARRRPSARRSTWRSTSAIHVLLAVVFGSTLRGPRDR